MSGLGLTRAAIAATPEEEDREEEVEEEEASAAAAFHLATKPPGADSTSGPEILRRRVLPGTFPAIESSKEVAS